MKEAITQDQIDKLDSQRDKNKEVFTGRPRFSKQIKQIQQMSEKDIIRMIERNFHLDFHSAHSNRGPVRISQIALFESDSFFQDSYIIKLIYYPHEQVRYLEAIYKNGHFVPQKSRSPKEANLIFTGRGIYELFKKYNRHTKKYDDGLDLWIVWENNSLK